MGGLGSGERWDAKSTVEGEKGLDIRLLNRDGQHKSGLSFGTVSWSCRGEETGSIRFRLEDNKITLYYRYSFRGGEWKSVEQEVYLDTTACHFGGTRKWFRCPNCARRVVFLYGAGKYFLCRHCYDLNYKSQHERRDERLMRKARKIRERLGGGPSLFDFFPLKPKGMHWKTYERLREEYERANYISMSNQLAKIQARSPTIIGG